MSDELGGATQGYCPRWNYIVLRGDGDSERYGVLTGRRDHDSEKDYVVRTTCNTWRCKGCRTKVKARVFAMLKHGLSIPGPSWFITITYAMAGEGSVMDAKSVKRDWGLFCRMLRKRPGFTDLAYAKVPELTRRGQVHLHLLLTGVTKREHRCRRNIRPVGAVIPTCGSKTECMEHALRSAWYEVTGSSWIVDASVIRAKSATCHYVIKYMLKGGSRDALESLGLTRRFSVSRNWARLVPVRLAGTEFGWSSTTVDGREGRAKFLFDRKAGNQRMVALVGPQQILKRIVESKLRKARQMMKGPKG